MDGPDSNPDLRTLAQGVRAGETTHADAAVEAIVLATRWGREDLAHDAACAAAQTFATLAVVDALDRLLGPNPVHVYVTDRP